MLNHLATIWCHIVLSSLLPVSHATEIVVKRMVLIFCLMEGLYVDLPSLILSEMELAATKRVHLPYCSIITLLARRNGVDVALEGGARVQPEPAIDRKWVDERIYKGPVQQRYVQAWVHGEQLPQAPPPPPPPATLRSVMQEVQEVKRMQQNAFDMMARLTHQLANSLDLDAAEVFGGPEVYRRWKIAAGILDEQPVPQATQVQSEEGQGAEEGYAASGAGFEGIAELGAAAAQAAQEEEGEETSAAEEEE